MTLQTSRTAQVEDGATTGTMTAVRTPATGSAQVDERLAAQRRREAAARATIARDDTEILATGPRPRASLLATTSLILGLAASLSVLTGLLAGPGVGLGLLAAFAAIGGISATSRRHVAGKSDALLGMALGLTAIVIGTLILTGNLPWITSDTDQVMRVRDWLDARMPWMFPNS
jgi:hypothetical protein